MFNDFFSVLDFLDDFADTDPVVLLLFGILGLAVALTAWIVMATWSRASDTPRVRA